MYKLLLCWRYLRTRYIALASIISVTLGVATMIVVNSVMAGFTHEMQDRIHGILSDIVFESRNLDGAPDADAHMAKIREVAGQYIEGMSPTAHVPAMLGYYIGDQYRTQQINLIGIDPETYGSVSDFGKYLQHPENRNQLDFQLKQAGYDVVDHQAEDPSLVQPRPQMKNAGWLYRKAKYGAYHAGQSTPTTTQPPTTQTGAEQLGPTQLGPTQLGPTQLGPTQLGPTQLGPTQLGPTPSTNESMEANNPFAAAGGTAFPTEEFNPAKKQHVGCVMGIALASYRAQNGTESFLQLPGDDIEITYPSAGRPPKPQSATFTVTDFYESKMAEYDGSFVFVPLRRLQELRGMVDVSTCEINPSTGELDLSTGVASFNAIQIRLKEGVDENMVRDLIRDAFQPQFYVVSTWQDKQGALLAAVQMETAVLNVLLFLIIAVAGFGILAIFCLIVVEKTRDIGVLKSLGASRGGIMTIFLGYGLALGIVGSGVGALGGLLLVDHINEAADFLGWLTGKPVFDPSIYFFQRIPTIVHATTVLWIMAGAIGIAVAASVLPALRAAYIHPVSALNGVATGGFRRAVGSMMGRAA